MASGKRFYEYPLAEELADSDLLLVEVDQGGTPKLNGVEISLFRDFVLGATGLGSWNSSNANSDELDDDLILTNDDYMLQVLDPGGADRVITLPAEDANNHGFVIINNADAEEALTVKDNIGTTIAIVRKGEARTFVSDSAAWYTQEGEDRPVWSDGWQAVFDTWAYASASTVTVPSGAANKFMVGQKVKFTQTTVKYFIITGVTDTVLTLFSPFGSTVANAAISSISISAGMAPAGFNVGYTQHRLSSSQLDMTSNTSFTDVPGLTANVVAGGYYKFRASLMVTTGGSGKFTIAGTATATAIRYVGGIMYNNGGGALLATALGADVYSFTSTAVVQCFIEGYIQVNAGGTLQIQFAQKTSSGTTSSVYVGSSLEVTRVG
jgi:hypothetical protein